MAATYPSPNEEATLRHYPDGTRDLENPPNHHDDAGSESQRSMRPRSLPPSVVPWETDSSSPMSSSTRGITPSWKQHLQVFGKYLLVLVLIVGITAIVAALGVLTAPVSAVLLVVFLITYSFARPAQILGNKKIEYITRLMMACFTGVALLLFVALVVLFFIFRFVPSLESEEIVGMEVWKWLEIALVSCLFGIIWIGGSFLWTYVQLEYDYKKNLVYFVNASRWAVNCICFFGGELLVLKVAPGSKSKVVIYGLPIWKWIAVIDLIICACHVIRIVTRAVVLFLDAYRQNDDDGGKNSHNKYVVYMGKGLRGSINVVLFLVLILLTWAFYVQDRLDLDRSTDDAKRFLRYAKGTFLSILVGSVLWVFKNFVLLLWEARQVYKRLTDRMLKAWMQLYFLIMIFGLEEAELVNWSIHGNDGAENQGNTTAEDDQKQQQPEEDNNGGHQHDDANSSGREELQAPHSAASTGSKQVGNIGDVGGDQTKKTGADESAASEKKKEERRKRKTQNAKEVIQQILDRAKKQTLNYDVLQRMSGYLVAADALWTSKEDAGSTDSVSSKISTFGEMWKKQYPDNKDGEVSIDELGMKINTIIKEEDNSRDKVGKDELNHKDLKLLYAQLQEVDRTRKEVWFGDLEKWLTRAYKNCQTLGRALAGNQEGAVYLNKILTVAVATAVLIVWLFLVKLASIEFIAAIASPLIAVAFVFGDTAKTLFQGMIFAFGVHPFDVGDMCVINDTQTLEVKRLGIWKTVFLKEGCKDEEVIYPNSALATATIVKHKSVLDLSDYLEFYVSKIATTEQSEEMKKLRKDIKRYLKDKDEKFEKKCSQVVVKALADKVKIGVRYKHLMSFQDMSYLECLKKKNKSTSELLEHIMLLVDAYEKKVAIPQTENNVVAEQGDDKDDDISPVV